MIYYPSLENERNRQDSIALTQLLKRAFGKTYRLPCSNCGSMTDFTALKTRHGMNGSYSTCPACDIELENY